MNLKLKNTVFGDLPLIEYIISDYWRFRIDIESSDEELMYSQHWYACLTKYSELIIDISEDAFFEVAKTNPIYKQLLKSSISGGSKVICWKSFKDELENDQRFIDFSNSLFLLDSTSEECSSNRKAFGMIFLNKENYKSYTERLFLLSDFQVRRNIKLNNLKSWSGLNKISHPMNSLLISDNYILNSENDISNNLIPLLNALLPAYLDKINFQILIVSKDLEDKLLDKRYTFLSQQISQKIKRPFKIELTLITASIGKNHDRHIFTNYFMLESGNSINYFDEKGNVKVNTYLHAFPSYQVVSGPELMLNKNLSALSDIKDLVLNHSRQQRGDNKIKDNRLFKMIP